MVAFPRLCVLLAGISALSLFSPHLLAQAAGAAPAPPTDFEKIVAEFKKQDDDLRKSSDDLRALIEAELAAKRLDPNAAQSMLWSLRANIATGFVDLRALAAARITMQIPNETVAAAAQKLDALTNQIQGDRVKLRDEALEAARKRAVQVARTAQQSAEIDPLVGAVESLQTTLGPRVGNGFQVNGELGPVIVLLRNMQAALAASEGSDPKLVGIALGRLAPANNNDTFGWTAVDAQKRITGFLKPYAEAVASAQTALDQALLAGQPVKNLAASLARLETAEGNLQAAHPIGFAAGDGSALTNYRTLVGLARAVEEHDAAYLKMNLANARHGLVSLGAERANDFDHLFVQWEKQLNIIPGPGTAGPHSAWSERLATVKSPEDLEAIALDLQHAERETNNERDPNFPRGLDGQLNALAAAWSSHNPTLIMAGNPGYDSGSSGGIYSQQINHLRERIERDVLSHTLHAPELLKPPLADQPLNTAVDALAQNLSDAHEWRRLLTLLEQRAIRLPGQESATTAPDDAVTAVRSYLAGQNFELAEQWSDAIVAYKTVLSSAAELGPIKDAAERLKVLIKEHPAVLGTRKTPATPTPGRKSPRH